MARRITRTFPDGDYVERLRSAYDAFEAARQAESEGSSSARTLTDPDPVDQLAQEYSDLKAEADADADAKGRVVTLEAVGRRVWRNLKEKHPPRSGDGVDKEVAEQDRLAGVNTDSIEDDLVYASVVRPEFTSRGAFDEWADALTEGEWKLLVRDAWSLVNVPAYDPKSLTSFATRSDDVN